MERHLQVKRNKIIYSNLQEGLNKINESSFINSMEDGEIVAIRYRNDKDRVSVDFAHIVEEDGGVKKAVTNQYVKKIGDEMSGNLTIGTDEMSGNLTVKGNITAKEAIYSSDKNLKENIVDIKDEDIDKVKNVKVKQFNFIADEKKNVHYGVIAQDIEELGLENLVEITNEGTKGVNYTSLLMLKIAQMEKEINFLKNEIFILKNK